MAKEILSDIASKYMNKSYVLGFETAIECIEMDIENASIVHEVETLTSLTKKLRKVLVMYKKGVQDNVKD